MKFFVTGVSGQLGHDVMNELAKRGYDGVGSDIQPEYCGVADGSAITDMPYVQLDITDKEAVKKVITEIKPDAVIHCAAWTAVDMAEDDDKVEKVRAVNAGGTQNIADVCKEIDCKMLYLSTDYVFDGQGTQPWQPDCKDYKPLNVYGQTKLEGELAVSRTLEKYFIVRIAWVFGLNGKNFIKTMINVGKAHDEVRVVNVLIAAVAMNMNASYNKLVTKHLTKAQIVYDRFHMQSQFGRDVLGVVRLDEARRHKAKEKEILVNISNDTDKDTMKSLKQEAKSEKQGYSQLKKRACKRCSG